MPSVGQPAIVTIIDEYDDSLELACIKRDALVDRLLASKDYRRGSSGADALMKYLSGHRHSNPNGIPTQLRQAQEDVLALLPEGLDRWKT